MMEANHENLKKNVVNSTTQANLTNLKLANKNLNISVY